MKLDISTDLLCLLKRCWRLCSVGPSPTNSEAFQEGPSPNVSSACLPLAPLTHLEKQGYNTWILYFILKTRHLKTWKCCHWSHTSMSRTCEGLAVRWDGAGIAQHLQHTVWRLSCPPLSMARLSVFKVTLRKLNAWERRVLLLFLL